MDDPVFIIGIDLGTTNSVVAYTKADAERFEEARVRIFDVPQTVDAGSVENRPVTSVFCPIAGITGYSRGRHRTPLEQGGLACRRRICPGARRRDSPPSDLLFQIVAVQYLGGPKGPHIALDGRRIRKIHSGREKDVTGGGVGCHFDTYPRCLEPYHGHHRRGELDDRLKMENQLIYLTVPASFDAVARQLTVMAAEIAGLSHATLLEEPQAAFYAWVGASDGKWRERVFPGNLILVCDVGGGTSDFSLIRVGEEEGDLTLDRIAVGNHILVGGDNMDLALAYRLSHQLAEQGTRLDTWQMKGLWQSCRRAKERLLSDPGTQSLSVAILGRGSSLIGGTISTELTRQMVDEVLRDGFFPTCARTDKPKAAVRSGIQEFGLTFEADAGITRHLAAFLDRQDDLGELIQPTTVLFNGGVMKSGLLRDRVISILKQWTANDDIQEIDAIDYDLAVARGAAYYGLARQGSGIRIRGGIGRSYYIGIAAAMPAVPGMPALTKALCVAPFGMEEGTVANIPGQEFVLVVGHPVSFDFMGSTTRQEDEVGTVLEEWQGEIEAITTIETTLEGDAGQAIPVALEIEVTEVGTLELYCASKIDDRKWKLEFNVREQ